MNLFEQDKEIQEILSRLDSEGDCGLESGDKEIDGTCLLCLALQDGDRAFSNIINDAFATLVMLEIMSNPLMAMFENQLITMIAAGAVIARTAIERGLE